MENCNSPVFIEYKDVFYFNSTINVIMDKKFSNLRTFEEFIEISKKNDLNEKVFSV
jgi:hypothetical protein